VSNAPLYVTNDIFQSAINFREYNVDGGAWTTRTKTPNLVSNQSFYPAHVTALVQ
jgi:hypothetical protein